MTILPTSKCDKWAKDPAGELPCYHYIFEENDAGFCKLGSQFRCPEGIKSKAMRLSHSTIQDIMHCKRLAWLKHVKGLEVRPHRLSYQMKMGSLWDIYQDVLYGIAQFNQNPKWFADTLNLQPNEQIIKQYYNTKIKKYIDKAQMDEISVAKVKAVYRAFKFFMDEGLLKLRLDSLVGMQKHFLYHLTDEFIIHGYTDRLYDKYFTENKFVSDRQYYDTPWAVSSQVGTYFLAYPDINYMYMEIIQTPKFKLLKKGKNRKYDETIQEYENRTFNDVISRPSHYFVGFDRKKKTYGIKMYRNEFALDEIENRYRCLTRETMERAKRCWWYKENGTACYMYGQDCEFKIICKTNGYPSMERFQYRDANKENVLIKEGDV